MGHLTSRERWGVVDLDTRTGRVFVQEDWHYIWLLYPGVTEGWTYPQMRGFHHTADTWIWRLWSNRLHLSVTGHAPFASKRVPINFDIRWKPHLPANWTIFAWKVPTDATPTDPVRSQVRFDKLEIDLSTADTGPRPAGNDAGQATDRFVTPPHEFGHTMEAPDEYNLPQPGEVNPYLRDRDSIMNVGRDIRGRHLALVVDTLNRMMPGAKFQA